jgi:hypothetical protein
MANEGMDTGATDVVSLTWRGKVATDAKTGCTAIQRDESSS